jgi:transcriptional regulator with XRE-family HTH domain
MKVNKEKLDHLIKKSKKNTQWKDLAEKELNSGSWIDRSFEIALTVLEKLDEDGISRSTLAKRMNCSRQYLNKLLKGRENLTLETIDKLENALNTKIIAVCGFVDSEWHRIDEKIRSSNFNQVSFKYEQVEKEMKYSETRTHDLKTSSKSRYFEAA